MKRVPFSRLSKTIEATFDKIIKKSTVDLKDDIVSNWPVKTGRSKRGWAISVQAQFDGKHYIIYNPVRGENNYPYVRDLWRGLPAGSKQLPNGGDPIVARHIHKLSLDLKKARL